MWVDLIGLAVLAVFVGLGLLRGTLAGLLRVGTLVGAYALSVLAARLGAHSVALRLGVSDLIGAIAIGTLGFLLASLILGLISRLVLRGDKRRAKAFGRSSKDRAGGALIGGLQGGLVVLLIGWLAIWLDAAQLLAGGSLTTAAPSATSPSSGSTGGAATSAQPEPARRSIVTRVTREVVEDAAELALGDSPEARMATGFAARPAETISGLQNVLDSPQIAALRDDELFWQYLSTGAVDQALNRMSFRSLSYDASLRGRMVDLGLVGEAARNDPVAFREVSRQMLADIGPRLQALRNDPELQALAANPQVQQAIAQGDTVSLLMNPAVRSFVNRVTEQAGTPPAN